MNNYLTKEDLQKLKENNDIKFIYKIPCSYYKEGYEYIIIGVGVENQIVGNITTLTIDDWFLYMKTGSLLPFLCSTLSKSGKLKEFINIYEKPDILTLRRYITSLSPTDRKRCIQECLWGEQLIKEGKINRIDVFKNNYNNVTDAKNRFYEAVDPIYKMSLSTHL